MSLPLSFSLLHIIFSTKHRDPLIPTEILSPLLHAQLATVARDKGCDCYRVGGISEQVHLAIRISSTISIADLVKELKTSSSHWMQSQGITFSWKKGYGAFSLNLKTLQKLCDDIENEEEHSLKSTFLDDYRTLLNKYGIEYDENYV